MLTVAFSLVNWKEELSSTFRCEVASGHVTVHKKLILVSFAQGATCEGKDELQKLLN